MALSVVVTVVSDRWLKQPCLRLKNAVADRAVPPLPRPDSG